MKRDCKPFWQGIVELAEARENSDTQAHVDSCAECQVLLQQAKQVLSAAGVRHFKAPADLIAAAKSLMPDTPTLRVLRTSLQLAGARLVNQDFQVVYAAEGLELRVSYTKTEGGWEVVGKMPSEEWAINKKKRSLRVFGGGRFSFIVKSLDQSDFVLITSNRAFRVPSGTEAVDESSRDS